MPTQPPAPTDLSAPPRGRQRRQLRCRLVLLHRTLVAGRLLLLGRSEQPGHFPLFSRRLPPGHRAGPPHRRRRLLVRTVLCAALLLAAGAGAAHAGTGGSDLPWNHPLQVVVDNLTGPTAKTYPYKQVIINNSPYYEDRLRPVIEKFQWLSTGGDTAVVSFSGRNFFPGTQIQLGGKSHSDPASGLLIKSDISMELTASLEDLALGDAFISGRYGTGITGPPDSGSSPPPPAGADRASAAPSSTSGILINAIKATPLPGKDQVQLDVILQGRDGSDLLLNADSHPLLTVEGTVLPDPYIQPARCMTIQLANPVAAPQERSCYRLSSFVKSTLVSASAIVGVRYPFRGPHWASSLVYSAPSLTATRQRTIKLKKKTETVLLITGAVFDSSWTIELDRLYTVTAKGPLKLDQSKQALTLTVDDTTLAGYKQLVAFPPPGTGKALILVTIPDAKPTPSKPTLDTTKPLAPVTLGSAPAVVMAGKALDAIKQVTFEDENLPFQPAADGSKITVILSRSVTRKAGKAVVILRPASGDFLPVEITVNP